MPVGFLIILSTLLVLYLLYRVQREKRIQRVKEMMKRHISFNELFGEITNVSDLSSERLKHILKTPETELRKHDEAIEEERRKQQKYDELKQRYPLGVVLYGELHPSAKYIDYLIDEQTIKRLEKTGQQHQQFIGLLDSQKTFAERCQSLIPKNWGATLHEISIEQLDEYGEGEKEYPYEFWHVFLYPFCNDISLDYSSFSHFRTNAEVLDDYMAGRLRLDNSVFDTLVQYIQTLSDDICVLFTGDPPSNRGRYYNKDGTINNPFFKYLKGELSRRNIYYTDLSLYQSSLIKTKDIILVDYVSLNTPLVKWECHKFITDLLLSQDHSRLLYFSIFRGYDSDEMGELISNYNKERQNREKQQRELAEKTEIEKEKKRNITQELLSAVSSWGIVPYSEIHHEFLIRYYPTTCEFSATDEEWNDRQLIWSFKNDPNKSTRISHQQALSVLIPRLKSILNRTFGNLLSNLTLVCIPASSPEKNKARYEDFSKQLCESTGMMNAYPHLTVNGERVARHVGGEAGGTDSITFDEDYFKEKNILLFDDILTGGGSMRRFSSKLSSLGANVIAGLTIGKTFHTREENTLSSSQSSSFDDVDLPF